MTVHDSRDRYGLQHVGNRRVVVRINEDSTDAEKQRKQKADRRNKLASQYYPLRQELSWLLDDKVFVSESIRFLTSKSTGIPVEATTPKLEYEENDSDIPLDQRIENVKTRMADASLTYRVDVQTLQMLNKALIAWNLGQHKNPPEPNMPEIFYRAFTPQSHSRFDKDLGFRSSRQPMTSPCYHTGTLASSALVSKNILRNHCGGQDPSDIIAMSDSPQRILNFIPQLGSKDQAKIAVISSSKLLAMSVLFNRTTTLAESLKVNLWTQIQQNGLPNVNYNYWVAYRWIPAECIDMFISISSLEKACEKHGIGPWNYDRLCFEDLLASKMEEIM